MEDGSASNGDSVYDVAVEDDGSSPATAAEVAALKSQVESLSNDLKGSRSAVAALESQIEAYAAGRVEAARRIEELEGEAKALGAVAARASELEGDVARLQHDLVAAMSEGEENAAEAAAARKEVEGIQAEKAALAASVAEMEGKVEAMEAEKRRVQADAAGKEARVRELEELVKGMEEKGRRKEFEKEAEVKGLLGKMELLLKDVDAKEVQVAQAKKLAANAALEADALRSKLEELAGAVNGTAREVEIEVVGGGKGGGRVDWKSTVAMAALPAATAVVVGAAICYLHYARRR